MIILPAIDIRAGKVVRLFQGDFTKEKVYSGDPANIAKRWELEGAKMLHVVDLDGAFLGRVKNLPVIREITSSVKIPVELGGGIRTEGEFEQALSSGIKRVIIGTRAYTDENFVKKLVKKYRDSVVVSIDAANGEVISEGWKKKTFIKAAELVKKMQGLGVTAVIYTDILQDGTMQGPNLGAIEEILDNTSCDVIVSGGISSLEDIRALKRLAQPANNRSRHLPESIAGRIGRKNLAGIIVGKALYEGAFTLREANGVLENRHCE